MKLQNKVAIITGSSRGIGQATVTSREVTSPATRWWSMGDIV